MVGCLEASLKRLFERKLDEVSAVTLVRGTRLKRVYDFSVQFRRKLTEPSRDSDSTHSSSDEEGERVNEPTTRIRPGRLQKQQQEAKERKEQEQKEREWKERERKERERKEQERNKRAQEAREAQKEREREEREEQEKNWSTTKATQTRKRRVLQPTTAMAARALGATTTVWVEVVGSIPTPLRCMSLSGS
jgi:septal ring factor EnvC (AmiA/AmiB activator)